MHSSHFFFKFIVSFIISTTASQTPIPAICAVLSCYLKINCLTMFIWIVLLKLISRFLQEQKYFLLFMLNDECFEWKETRIFRKICRGRWTSSLHSKQHNLSTELHQKNKKLINMMVHFNIRYFISEISMKIEISPSLSRKWKKLRNWNIRNKISVNYDLQFLTHKMTTDKNQS